MLDKEELKARVELAEKRLGTSQTTPQKNDKKDEKQVENLDDLKQEIEKLKQENKRIKFVSSLTKFGCLKPELVAGEIPSDCENLDEWVKNYKSENEFLFRQSSENHGGSFKPAKTNNLSPTELMNNFIRGI